MVDSPAHQLRTTLSDTWCPTIRLSVATILFVLSLATSVYWTGSYAPGSTITVVRGWELALGDLREWPDQIKWGRFKFRRLLFSAPTVNGLFIATALLDLIAIVFPRRALWAAWIARWSATVAFGYAVASALLLSFGILLGSGLGSPGSFTRFGLGMPLWLLAFFIQLFYRRMRRGDPKGAPFTPPIAA